MIHGCSARTKLVIQVTMSNFLQIFFFESDFFFAHRNRYWEGTNNGQITPLQYYFQFLWLKSTFFHIPNRQTDGVMDGWTDGQID
jgi:hypothetical protein